LTPVAIKCHCNAVADLTCQTNATAASALEGWQCKFRVATLNLEKAHKRWDARRGLVEGDIDRLKPDLMAFNEVRIPRQSARELRNAAKALTGIDYELVQQTRVHDRHFQDRSGDNTIDLAKVPPASTRCVSTW
jgi:hypothetical protein